MVKNETRTNIPMKIAYIASADLNLGSGVTKKILAQVYAWKSAGHEVKLYLVGTGQSHGTENLDIKCFTTEGFWDNNRVLRSIALELAEERPDIIYLRWTTYLPSIGRIFKLAPVVAELNSNELSELLANKHYKLAIYCKLTSRLFYSKASAIISVTRELAEQISAYNKRVHVISNGIELSRFSPSERIIASQPEAVFVGSGRYLWNGVDKILSLAPLIPQVTFNIVGDCLSSDNLPENVIAHGRLAGEALNAIVERSWVGFGTLALHRKNMEEACPIKVREYLASGLPTVIGYQDTDFIDNQPEFVLQIPNCENNVVAYSRQIEEFILSQGPNTVHPNRIAHLDVQVKESQRLDVFREVCTA